MISLCLILGAIGGSRWDSRGPDASPESLLESSVMNPDGQGVVPESLLQSSAMNPEGQGVVPESLLQSSVMNPEGQGVVPESLLQSRSSVMNPEGCPQNSNHPSGRTWSSNQVSAVLSYKYFNYQEANYCDSKQMQTSESSFQEFLKEEGGWPAPSSELKDHLQAAGSEPLIVFSVDHSVHSQSSAGVMLTDLFCRLDQLGLLHRTIVLASNQRRATFCPTKKGPCAKLHVFRDPQFWKVAKGVSGRMSFKSDGRMGKLLFSLYLLELGHSVVVADSDTVWLRDPTPYFANLNADMAAMQDGHCVELNSGFVYYRPTSLVKSMLRTAVGVVADKRFTALRSSDQYLLNCAWSYYVTHHKLTYAVLDDRFAFMGFGWNGAPYGLQGRVDQAAAPLDMATVATCADCAKVGGARPLQLPLYVWHTGDYTAYATGKDRGYRQLGMLLDYFGQNVGSDGNCVAPMPEQELRKAESRLYHSCVDEYNPTCMGPGIHGLKLHGASTCQTTVGDLISSAYAVSNAGALDWQGQKTSTLANMDQCVGSLWDGWENQRGTCGVGAEELLRKLDGHAKDKSAADAIAAICWAPGARAKVDSSAAVLHIRSEPVDLAPKATVHPMVQQTSALQRHHIRKVEAVKFDQNYDRHDLIYGDKPLDIPTGNGMPFF